MHRVTRELLRIAMRERSAGADRPRQPEPAAMDEPRSVEQFHAGGATVAAMRAVYELSAISLDALVPAGGRLLDLGVGSGRALARFVSLRPDVRATAVDLAPNMLAEARRLMDVEGGDRVTLVEGDLTSLGDELLGERWDAISSVWALHHLPSHEALRAALRQIHRLRERDGCAVWLLDFQRLSDPGSLDAMLDVLEPDLPSILHADSLASDAAAFTQAELSEELEAAGLDGLRYGVAQPIPWLQAFWCPPRRSATQQHPIRPAGEPIAEDPRDLRRNFSDLPG